MASIFAVKETRSPYWYVETSKEYFDRWENTHPDYRPIWVNFANKLAAENYAARRNKIAKEAMK